MAWIKVIEENKAEDELLQVYEKIQQRRGKLSNIMKAHSLNPAAMQAHLDLYLAVMFNHSRLQRELREMIAEVVSGINRCDYCVKHHSEALKQYWKDENRLRRFKDNFQDAGLSEIEREILIFSEKLTRNPAGMTRSDIDGLRRFGLDDRIILDITLIVIYFNWVNRIANGLGVASSADEIKGYRNE